MLMCSLCVSGSCCYPPSPLPGTAVSELQLTHLSRIRLVGCACESFGGCRVAARERGGCARLVVWIIIAMRLSVTACTSKCAAPSPPYPLYLPFSTFLCSCFSCCISFLMLTTCHIMQLHCHVAAAVELRASDVLLSVCSFYKNLLFLLLLLLLL